MRNSASQYWQWLNYASGILLRSRAEARAEGSRDSPSLGMTVPGFGCGDGLSRYYTSAYSASKFALEGYSEALRYELLPFGIHVSLVEPTGVKTGTQHASIRAVARASAIYGPGREQAHRDFVDYINRTGVGMDKVSGTVARVVLQTKPALRHPVGIGGLLLGKALLPQGMWESAMRRQFAVKVAHPSMAD